MVEPTAAQGATPTRRALRRAAPASASGKPPGKAGRDLRSAIAVGLGLGALVAVSLLVYKPVFLVVLVGAVVIAMHEVIRAVEHARLSVPRVPTMAAGVTLPVLTYLFGGEAMALTFAAGVLAILVWRVARGVRDAASDVAGGVLVLAYVPLLASFAALMLAAPDNGHLRVIVFVLVTICSDIGGYAVGVLKGKHPMAPSISPKKSWEGFAGSVGTCALVGALSVALVLDGPWWVGVLLGAATAATATIGDLCESVIKRDIGIKDMGNLLPGHGGLMDRLDSLLVVAPMAWLVLTYLLPQIGSR